MLKIFILILSIPFAAPALYAKEVLPSDVRKFVQTRDSCDHFRGEVPDPEEKERMREVVKQLDRFCKGTDRKLASLKTKYRANAGITRRLSTYESAIEGK
jgi:hypothetical protein